MSDDEIMLLINELAPTTRRDEWWQSPGPYEILRRHFETEREACANLAADYEPTVEPWSSERDFTEDEDLLRKSIAAAIRARGET